MIVQGYNYLLIILSFGDDKPSFVHKRSKCEPMSNAKLTCRLDEEHVRRKFELPAFTVVGNYSLPSGLGINRENLRIRKFYAPLPLGYSPTIGELGFEPRLNVLP